MRDTGQLHLCCPQQQPQCTKLLFFWGIEKSGTALGGAAALVTLPIRSRGKADPSMSFLKRRLYIEVQQKAGINTPY